MVRPMKGIITKLICCIAVCFCFFTIIVTFDGEPAGVNVLAEDGKQNSDEIDISDLWDVQPWVEVTVEEYTNRVIIKTYGPLHKLGMLAIIKEGDPIIYTGDNCTVIYSFVPESPKGTQVVNDYGGFYSLEPGTYYVVVLDEHNEVCVEPVYFEVKEIVATPTPTPTPTPTLPPTATPEAESTQTTEIEKTLLPTHQPTKQPTLQPTDASNHAEEENAPVWVIWISIAAVAAVGILVAVLAARKHKRK